LLSSAAAASRAWRSLVVALATFFVARSAARRASAFRPAMSHSSGGRSSALARVDNDRAREAQRPVSCLAACLAENAGGGVAFAWNDER
jgi:hypothetical protein